MRGKHYGDFFIIRSVSDQYLPQDLVLYFKARKKQGLFDDCIDVIDLPTLYKVFDIENYIYVILAKTRKGRKYCYNCRQDLELKKGDILIQRSGLNLGKIIRVVE